MWEYSLITNNNNHKLCIFYEQNKKQTGCWKVTVEILVREIEIFYILFFILLVKNA